MRKDKKNKRKHEVAIDTYKKINIICLIHSPSLYPQGYAAMRRVFS